VARVVCCSRYFNEVADSARARLSQRTAMVVTWNERWFSVEEVR